MDDRNHNMIPNGVLADHGELQCTYCGVSNLYNPKPESFNCPKNPKSRKCITCGTVDCDHQQTKDRYEYCCLDLPFRYIKNPWTCKPCGISNGRRIVL